jgi:hypothetical protein
MRDGIGKNILFGTAAGLAGTALIQGMMKATEHFAPETLPPMKEDPGKFMVKKAEKLLPIETRAKISEKTEAVASKILSFGYGTTAALLYNAIPRRARRLFLDGAALGGLTWAAGYLGWLPATKLTPPVTEHEPKQVVGEVASHVLFGIATIAVFEFLRERFEEE